MNKSQLHSVIARRDDYRRLSPRARSVYQFLWSIAGAVEGGDAGPWSLSCRSRVESVMDAEGCSRRTALYALGELELAGFIARARTGRASLFTLFATATPEAQHRAGAQARKPRARCNPLHIRCATGCTSEVQPVAHRAAPSICLDQDHSLKTTTPGAAAAAARVPGGGEGSQPSEPAELNGAAAVAFAMLTGPECPAACRFDSVFDRAQARRQVERLAAGGWPVVELVRYAIAMAGQPGVRSPRGLVIATLREPDLHAVYEHEARLRAIRERRRSLEVSEVSQASERDQRARADNELAHRVAATLAAATDTEIAAAIARLSARDRFVARACAGRSTAEIVARSSLRAAIAQEIHANTTPEPVGPSPAPLAG